MTYIAIAAHGEVRTREDARGGAGDRYVTMNKGPGARKGWFSRFTGGGRENKELDRKKPSREKKIDHTALPPGWSEERTEDGTQYFFNAKTGQSSWERPQW